MRGPRGRKARLLTTSYLLSAGFIIASGAPARADPVSDVLVKDLSTSSVKLGISMVRGVIQSQPPTIYIAPPDQGTAGQAIQEVVNSYARQKASAQGQITITEGVVNRLADVAAATTVAASGGTGALPVALARTAVQAATDDYFASARAKAQESVTAFLARNQAKIVSDSGLNYDDLRNKTAEEIRNRLDRGSTTFTALGKVVKDPDVREFAKGLLVEAIVNTQKSTLDQLAAQGASITGLGDRVKTLESAHQQLAQLTVTTLAAQQKSIDQLSQSLGKLDAAVGQVDARLQIQNETATS